MAYAYTMKEEGEDLLENRMSSFRLTRSTGSAMSSMSSMSNVSSVADDARLLSHATSQATTAARSILISGGTEETALMTAKAAAQSVLAGHHENRLARKGPKAMMLKRKIKKQAEVVSSMALVSAVNAVSNNEWNTLGDDQSGLKSMPAQLYMRENASAVSSLSSPNRAKSLAGFGKKLHNGTAVDTIEEVDETASHSVFSGNREQSMVGGKSLASGVSSSPSVFRPVAIHVETANRRSPSRKQKSSPRRGLSSAAEDYSEGVSGEDPIYAMSTSYSRRTASHADSDDESDDDSNDESGEEEDNETRDHSDDYSDEENESRDLGVSESAFSEGAPSRRRHTESITLNRDQSYSFFGPFADSFSNTFTCFNSPPTKHPQQMERELEQMQSLVSLTAKESQDMSHTRSSIGNVPTDSAVNSEDEDVVDVDGGGSDDSDDSDDHGRSFFSDLNYDRHALSKDESTHDSRDDRQSAQQSAQQSRPSKQKKRELREGRDEIELESLGSESSSSDDSTEYPRRRKKNALNWRNRRQRRQEEDEGVYA